MPSPLYSLTGTRSYSVCYVPNLFVFRCFHSALNKSLRSLASPSFCGLDISLSCSKTAASIGSIIDVVAVLLIHIDKIQVGNIKPNISLNQAKY